MHARLLLAAAISAVVLHESCRADVLLFGQMPVDQLSSLNSQFTGGSEMRRTADDFWLPTGNTNPYAISRVTGYMHSSLGAADPSRYGVEIYADAGGAPGAMLLQRIGASRLEDRGWAPSNMRIVEAIFDVGFSAAAGQRYWVSVFGVDGTTGQTRFSTYNYGGATQGYTARYQVGGGAWSPVETSAGSMYRDFAFGVYGAQLVPGPGAAGALGLGIWGVAGRRRRR
ncbi:MAG: hypothetical protein JNJ48_06600 [Phycisphaerae bacterium]|nr:hypothetical protein [Phycisphaerae bacterium]